MNEVKLDDSSQSTANVEFSAAAGGIVVDDPEDNDDKDWVSLNEIGENLGLPHDVNLPRTISERIAQVSAESSFTRLTFDGNPRNSSCRTSQKRQ